MLRNLLRRLGLTAPSDRPVSRSKRLRLESLEAREVPATIFAIAPNNHLLRFDSASANAVNDKVITGLGANQTVRGIDFRTNGDLVVTAVTTGTTGNSQLFTYKLNPNTATATLIGTSANLAGAADRAGGYDFNPTVDRIRYVNFPGENARINPTDGSLDGDDTDLTGGASLLGVAYDRNDTSTATPTTLFGIDAATANLVRIGGVDGAPSPNGGAITPVGVGVSPLGFQPSFLDDGGFDISDTGAAFAAITDDADPRTRLYSINLNTGRATSLGLIRDGNTEIFGIAIAPATFTPPASPVPPVLIVGSGPGANADVRMLNPRGGGLIRRIANPFGNFQGGVVVAAGDVNDDRINDAIVVANGQQGHVKVFSGANGALLASFFAFEGFKGTVNVACADVNRDGRADVIVVASGATGANGHVKAIDALKLGDVKSGGFIADSALLGSFYAYDNYAGTVAIAAANFVLDGNAEIVTVAATGAHVKFFTSDGGLQSVPVIVEGASSVGTASFQLNALGNDGPVSVAAGDVTGDSRPDLLLSNRSFLSIIPIGRSGLTLQDNPLSSFFEAAKTLTILTALQGIQIPTNVPLDGPSMALADVDGDGRLDLVATPTSTRTTVLAEVPAGGGFVRAENVLVSVTAPTRVIRLTGTFDDPDSSRTATALYDAFADFRGGATVAGA